MLPVVAGRRRTRRQILLYSVAAGAGRRAPWLLGYAGAIYGVTALIAGAALMVALAWRLRVARDGAPTRRPWQLFAFSILYLFALFAVLLVEGGLAACSAAARREGLVMHMDDKPERIVLTEEQQRSRRARSIAIALALGVLVILFYVVTLVKGPARAEPSAVTAREPIDERRTPQRTAPPPRPPGRGRLRRVRGGDGRRGLRGGAALQLVLPHHRIWRHHRRSRARRPRMSLERKIVVRFDANVAGGLPWRFEPEQNSVEVRIGDVVTVNYVVTNESARETVGQASYNVSPPTVGAYFSKINCFCFTEQRFKPGETARHAGGVLRRSRRWPRIPSRTTSTPSPCPTPCIRCASREPPRVGSRAALAPGRS